jgi:hypothetical protein
MGFSRRIAARAVDLDDGGEQMGSHDNTVSLRPAELAVLRCNSQLCLG